MIGGVSGEVIDVGLVRIHLMEMGGAWRARLPARSGVLEFHRFSRRRRAYSNRFPARVLHGTKSL